MTKKFGTFDGVFVPSFEAIVGTVLFLLLPLLTAQIGFVWMIFIAVLAHTVTLSTTSSLADCVTNLNRIGGGGLYAICKESLGKALGGSIGLSLFLAQVASVGFYIIGFTDTLYPLLQDWWEPLLPENLLLYAKPLLASAFLVSSAIVVLVGARFVIKLQFVIFVVLCLSLLALFIAPFFDLHTTTEKLPVYRLDHLNIWGKKTLSFTLFFVIFTQFFPAVTGISAGIGMSGELKTPQRSMVRGTFSAILVTFVLYILVILSYSFISPTLFPDSGERLLPEILGIGKAFPHNILAILVLLGVLIATASSGLSLFVTGPRTLQSIILDGLLPKYCRIFARDFKRGGREPRFAILLCLFMSLAVIWSGDLSFAATLVGILFLLVYAWVNGSAFLERISQSPTFRPSFKGHWAISLYGLCSSILVIALYNWILGLFLVLSQLGVFWLLLRYKTNGALEGVWWGLLFNTVNRAAKKLRDNQSKTSKQKNWRPMVQAIALKDSSGSWRKISEFALQIGEFGGFVEFHLLASENKAGDSQAASFQTANIEADLPQKLLHRVHPYNKNPGAIATEIIRHSGLVIAPNTLLLEAKDELELLQNLKLAKEKNWHSILYRPSVKAEEQENKRKTTIDVWWHTETNGNFMLILAYIINQHRRITEQDILPLRLFHYLEDDVSFGEKERELEDYLKESRLEGEVVILPHQKNASYIDMMSEHSSTATYVFAGLPGGKVDSKRKRVIKLEDFFFDRMIRKFSPEVSVIFVKCAEKFRLI